MRVLLCSTDGVIQFSSMIAPAAKGAAFACASMPTKACAVMTVTGTGDSTSTVGACLSKNAAPMR